MARSSAGPGAAARVCATSARGNATSTRRRCFRSPTARASGLPACSEIGSITASDEHRGSRRGEPEASAANSIRSVNGHKILRAHPTPGGTRSTFFEVPRLTVGPRLKLSLLRQSLGFGSFRLCAMKTSILSVLRSRCAARRSRRCCAANSSLIATASVAVSVSNRCARTYSHFL